MKIYFSTILFLLCLASNAEKYLEGYFVKTNQDTVYCKIKDVDYASYDGNLIRFSDIIHKNVVFKLNRKKQKITIDSVEAIYVDRYYYDRVDYEHCKFGFRMIEGKITLHEVSKVIRGTNTYAGGVNGIPMAYGYSSSTVIYLLSKGDQSFKKIKRNDFKNEILKFVGDCAFFMNEKKQKKLKYKDIHEIIEKYNSICN